MEFRVMEYFLAVAREQNITRAAEFLHITQPTLSRQLTDLERELGKTLMIRGKRKITLTEDGMLFRKRAEEIAGLMERTLEEMKHSDHTLSGDLYLGSGESLSIRNILHTAKEMQQDHPDVHFHITSGDSADLLDRLDKGLFDFCILFGSVDHTKYEYLTLPYRERWSVLMHQDMPLSKHKEIETSMLWDVPLIVSRQISTYPQYYRWLGKPASELTIAGSYNLINNAALMAEEQMGYVITLENIINTSGTALCFRPLLPERTLELSLVWKRYQPMNKIAEDFLKRIETANEQYLRLHP